ncbi:MAG: FUSC family protein, partial [Nocardioidaceae bacterium]
RRMDFTTRQAVQVTLAGVIAVVLGRELDSTRYYWAVITAFIAFTGTGTRSEAFLKAFNRVLGTLLGLGAGIWLAQLTAGHTAWMLAVIIASVFFGFYLQRVSYAYMIFFITIMIAQLYGILHQFSDGLLMLRLEETVIGAVAGIAVALLFTPLSTRDTISATQSRLLTDLADLLETAAGTAAGGLDAAMRGVDNRLRQLLQAVAPLSHPLVWDASPGATRHRLTLYGSCVRTTRSLAATLRHDPARQDPALEACRPLASAARRIAVHPGPPGARPYEPGQPLLDDLARADEILFADAEPPASPESPRRALVRLHELLEELAVGERPAAGGQSYAELSR